MSNWKSPRLDYTQGFWLRRFNSFKQTITDILNNELQSSSIPGWMMEGRTVLIQKKPTKVNTDGKYRPIECLNLLGKLLTGSITDKLYEHLEIQNLLPKERKGCRRRSSGTKDQLLIDKSVIKNCKKRKTNLNMAWINFRKAHNMVPYSWMIKSLGMVGAATNIVNLFK